MPQTNTTLENVPVHLGLILDGNRRWAREHEMPTMEGHKKGYENLKVIAEEAFDSGVKYVSAYVFSTENWNRSKDEIGYLMKLLLWVAKNEIKELDKRNIKVRFLGEPDKLSEQVKKAMRDAEERTKNNNGGTLLLCLNYGGQQEIASALNRMIKDKTDKGVELGDVTVERITQYIHEPSVPAVDLIIRTSGEQRLSNFMLWRAAYSELYFTDVHWPAFSKDNLKLALSTYADRQRRFGK